MSKTRKFAIGTSALAIAVGSLFAGAASANADVLSVETCTTDYGARALCAEVNVLDTSLSTEVGANQYDYASGEVVATFPNGAECSGDLLKARQRLGGLSLNGGCN